MELLVREVQLDDAEAIVGILNPIIKAEVYTAFTKPFTVEAEREYILHFPQHGVFHVAVCRHEQKIVGFQSMEPFATYTHAFDHVGVLGTYVGETALKEGFQRQFPTEGDPPSGLAPP